MNCNRRAAIEDQPPRRSRKRHAADQRSGIGIKPTSLKRRGEGVTLVLRFHKGKMSRLVRSAMRPIATLSSSCPFLILVPVPARNSVRAGTIGAGQAAMMSLRHRLYRRVVVFIQTIQSENEWPSQSLQSAREGGRVHGLPVDEQVGFGKTS